MPVVQHIAALDDNIRVIITHFRQDGEKWLTTGQVDVYKAVDKAHAQALADQHGGYGRNVYAGNSCEQGASKLHETTLVWEQ